jgi:hypothetical protein
MAGVVVGHVLDVMDRPWQWGEADCCTAACDVFLRLTDIDPMAALRGRYRTRGQAYAVIRDMGGFEAMADTLAAQAGLTAVADGQPGDIGVGILPGGRRALVVCIAPGRYAGKTQTGFTTIADVARCYHA